MADTTPAGTGSDDDPVQDEPVSDSWRPAPPRRPYSSGSDLLRLPEPEAERTYVPGEVVHQVAWSQPGIGEAEPVRYGDEEDGEPEPSEPRKTAVGVLWPWGLHGLVETLEVLALALLMFIAVRSMAQNFVVDGGSMEPTFRNGEMLIVNKLAYRSFDVSWLPWTDNDDWRPFGTPEPGDVVVFRFPQDQNRDFIKRVVAVPGQTVEVRGGKVYIDGVPRSEPYLDQAPMYEYAPVAVPEGQLFVLGDNRNNSYDSHSWGLLDQSLLIGRAELRYWPLDRIGRVGHDGPSEAATPQAGVTQSR